MHRELGLALSGPYVYIFGADEAWDRLFIHRLDLDLRPAAASVTYEGITSGVYPSILPPKAIGRSIFVAVPTESHDLLVLRYNRDLKLTSTWHFDGVGGGQATGLEVDDEEHVFVTGTTRRGAQSPDYDAVTFRAHLPDLRR